MEVKFDCTINDISAYFKGRGFFYSEEQIYNLYISLKTKPFVILSGISGSGKSKIVDLFADYMSNVYGNRDNYELIPVKPNWTDSRGIFGYHNLLNDTYQITPTVRLFLRALANPSHPYFLVLDEMNLAKVEYYFSDFLSLLESRRFLKINLTSISTSDISEIFENFENTYNERMSLSQAIILSALLLPNRENFKSISDLRGTEVANLWKEKYFGGEETNWTPMFRTELNQGRPKDELLENGYRKNGSRIAGKAFWAAAEGNKYKLKEISEMDINTRTAYEQVTQFLVKEEIKQEKMNLHGENLPIKTQVEQIEYNGKYFDGINYFVPSKLEIPANVFVIGTVNIDETTYMFSPKVLDRSNVLEFNDIDLFHAYDFGFQYSSSNGLPTESQKTLDLNISNPNSDSTKRFIATYRESFEVIYEIFELLRQQNRQFGYRVFNEISQFILNYVGESALENEVTEAVDLQLLQKILPKINGTDGEILELMVSLQSLAENNGLIRSKRKIDIMIYKLNLTGYATFIE